jgi:transmembrane sensor
MNNDIPDFIKKFKKGQLNEKEFHLFQAWLKSANEAQLSQIIDYYGNYFEQLPDETPLERAVLIAKIESKIDQVQDHEPRKKKLWPLLIQVTAIAAVLCVILFVFLYTPKAPDVNQLNTNLIKKPIVPGKNQATLTLSDGSTIALDSAKNGVLASQGNVQVYKSKTGQLTYNVLSAVERSATDPLKPIYNTISTPRGGQYQLTLPDGSKVWLNAASSLKYPLRFLGNKRQVELTGEAYFEIKADKQHPFNISVNHSAIEVLGTHFNVMGYQDEAETKTTLLAGSVKIISGSLTKMIIPGEQASVKDGIKVSKVNVSEAVEWKNGNFNFSHEKIGNIMRKISRWYDVDIQYNGKTTSEGFVGTIPRSKSIQEVLKYLELTELVHFKIIERRIIVMP